MRIRSQFFIMAAVITLIPVLLLAVGTTYWTFSKNQEAIPRYDELTQRTEELIDHDTWDKIREILDNRPRNSQSFVFDRDFRLIYGTMPLPMLAPGESLPPEKAINRLKKIDQPQDFFFFQPGGTKIWIVLVQDSNRADWNFFQRALTALGIVLLSMLLLSIVLSILMGRSVALTIVELERAVRQVAQGDYDVSVPVPIRGNDEIRSLGRAFEQMRVAIKEEEARRSRFIMSVSHDLKSPLTLIKGYVELLKDGPVPSPQAREAHFGLILDKVDQLDTMIDHLIDYGKVNTGEWQQTWTPVPLKAFLEDFCRTLAPDARLLGRTLVTDLRLPDDLIVTFDVRSIRRCLENLAHNALRYSEPGGTVGLEAKVREQTIELTVWDDGKGIAPEDLPHLFELFYRGTHSRREPGMGLGLAIVKTILDSHGWTVTAASDRGARFTVEIPLKPVAVDFG